MSKEKTTNKDNDINHRKMLYRVLWDEFEKLGILTDDDVIKIREAKSQAIKYYDLKDEETLKKIQNPAKREKESRRQLELRAKYNAHLVKQIRTIIHDKENKEDKPKALCLSGGGIRSATFNLGVLQGLAQHRLLDKFDYLSTVSGGGYIGSWFSAWINRTGSVEKVQAILSKDKMFPVLFGLDDFKKICDENEPINSLENLEKLKLKLNQNEERKFFGEIAVDKLLKIEMPEESVLRKNPSEFYKLKEFTKQLCRQLNAIILKKEIETPELEKKLPDNKDSFERSKAKRRVFNEHLVEFIEKSNDPKEILPKKSEPNDRADEANKKLEADIEHHDIEPEEITHLRTYSNYMSPRLGLFSTDSWALLSVYLRNLLLNWTVFVPFIAAILLVPKICSLLIQIQPDEAVKVGIFLLPLPTVIFIVLKNLNLLGGYEISDIFNFLILLISVCAGLVGVSNLNAMRPTLSEFSWVEQNYEVDDIGSVISVESKVLRWGALPLVILAVGMTFYWFSINRQPLIFPASFFNKDSMLLYKIIPFIAFSVVLFLGGFLITRLAIGFRKKNKDVADKWKHFKAEFFISALSGLIGGALLYVVVNNLNEFSVPIYNLFPASRTGEIRVWLYVTFGAPLFLMVFLLTATVFVGVASRITDDMDREWMARFGGWLLIIAIAWSAVSSLVHFGPELIDFLRDKASVWTKGIIASIGGFSGLITLVLGFSKKSGAEADKEPKGKKSFLLWFAPQVAAPIFALFLVILIVYSTNALIKFAEIDKFLILMGFSGFMAALLNYLSWLVILSVIVGVMGFCININKFSLHAAYRERLMRAYLGASRTRARLETANSFTGLDNADNVEMKELLHKPFHVINMTLNLASSSNLRWQQRKAESFTASALHCGSSNMGGSGNYRSSLRYAYNKQNDKAITLGTAAAISGAAASPNMGYFTSSSAVSFLMALFNVRLGWWLGNTGKRGDHTFVLTAPKFSLKPFIDEAFGRTNDTNPYIYLSDGGHFDNLGLYEMVLRRCHLIVVCDAACDANFEFFDFGSAIHKIRVDMGIPIEFKKETAPMKGRNCGIAKIKYSAVDGRGAEDGTLIYIKPTLDGDESIDLINYKKSNPDFPHESTADQMYSETQFESYRKLGFHMINSLCCQDKNAPCERCGRLSDLKLNAERYLQKHRPIEDYENLTNRRALWKRLFSGSVRNK